ncbi:MAG: class I SAM-dependent methyltransferase [Desulfocapsaceae bacterium]|nr:class I SAM-dependent methyltransferase [Desulfocapsaceae bacterium]
MDRKQIHKKVLEAKTTEELMDAYENWADQYDSDLLIEMGYQAPAITTSIFKKHLAVGDSKILDVGCGTGVVGMLLTQSGYTSVDGLDYSQGMLNKAKQKKIYSSLIQADLTKPLDIESNLYDAIISVGTFTLGHVGPDAFAELIRITKPGGILCFTVRQEAWAEHDYRQRTIDFELANKWELMEMQTVEYIREEGSSCKVLVYRVV